ncbi:hypothetical protein SDC9_78034 [bioreactor metagenome]|uniref:Uncharacterized protein n=1 Tax=bioreactor metagenome TaxID=1076179 RepID=A0A644YT30_9ZZZZ
MARRDDTGDAFFDQRFKNGNHFLRVILLRACHITGYPQIGRRVFHGVFMLLEVFEGHQRRHEYVDFFLVRCGLFRGCVFRSRGGSLRGRSGGSGGRFGAGCE